MDYKFKINKQVLTDFFLTDDEVTEEQLFNIRRVITAVLIKHFHMYKQHFDELENVGFIAICDHRKSFDPSYSAYNYCYCIARNEIGNHISKYSKEVLVSDILPLSNASSYQNFADLPSEINKFRKYLTGEQKFDVLDLTPQEAANLLCFFEFNIKSRAIKVPEFIESNPNALKHLYRILTHM